MIPDHEEMPCRCLLALTLTLAASADVRLTWPAAQAIANMLVWNGDPVVNVSGLDRATRSDVDAFRSAWNQFESRISETPTDAIGKEMLGKHQAFERTLFALHASPDLAAQFGTEAPISYEWEGYSEGPLGDASAAIELLDLNPTPVVRDYLHLIIGHRYLCAVPLLAFEKDQRGADLKSREAMLELRRAARSSRRLIRIAAVYLRRTRRCFFYQ